ncbi:MAG: DUF4380 domain-containing protein [Verrucomicrobia bacterium]|nr:DUF4380 domain-containing protein [Verrucomicrobiota bacterium]
MASAAGFSSLSAAVPPPVMMPNGVTLLTHTGWADSMLMTSSRESVKVVVAPAVGGRIVHYGLRGENILYENPASFGRTLADGRSSFSVGGYQCDVGPEIRGLPPHRAMWMGPHAYTSARPFAIRTTSPADTGLGLKLEKEIVMDPETGDLGITQRMKNISDLEVAYCLWDRTLCAGGGFAFFPLKKKSRFPARWSVRKEFEGKLYYDGDQPELPNVKVLDGVLVAKAEGAPGKLGADSDAGWIAYTRGKQLFVKYYPYFPGGDYTDGGNSVEFYWSDKVGELEPLSPQVRLRPGESYAFPEKWTLIELEEEATTFEQARSLVKKIPPTPFKK